MRELKVTQKDDYRMHNKITIKDFSIVSILRDQTYRVCPKGKAKNVTSPLFCMKIFLKDEIPNQMRYRLSRDSTFTVPFEQKQIAQVEFMFQDSSRFYLLSELCLGGSLAEILKDNK